MAPEGAMKSRPYAAAVALSPLAEKGPRHAAVSLSPVAEKGPTHAA